MQARLLQELPSLAELPGENVRIAAAQLSAFVPCSILEAVQAAPAGGGSNGEGGSDAEMVVVERGQPGGGASTESLEAMPTGAPLVLLHCMPALLLASLPPSCALFQSVPPSGSQARPLPLGPIPSGLCAALLRPLHLQARAPCWWCRAAALRCGRQLWPT